MSNLPADFKAAYEHVFLNQKTGNSGNAGVNYVRPYKKTKQAARMSRADAKAAALAEAAAAAAAKKKKK